MILNIISKPTQTIHRLTIVLVTLISVCLPSVAISQAISLNNQVWSAEVIRPSGQPVIPLFDGWYSNPDGTHSLCFSYFNLNTEQAFDIPVGDNNQLSDDRFNHLLPTHFDPLPPRYRHKFCVFTVQVPADFSTGETIVWSLNSGGETLSVPGHIQPPYVLDEPVSHGRGDIAPLVKLAPDSAASQGRNGVHTRQPLQAVVGEPLQLEAWIEHPDNRVWVGWAAHSGPGSITFDKPEQEVDLTQEPIGVIAEFDTPGDYIVRLQTIDNIAAFEFYCCHTNAYYHVTVGD